MAAPVLKQIWRYDFKVNVWTLATGSNPLTATAGKGLACYTNCFNGVNAGVLVPFPADSAGSFTDFTNASTFGASPMSARIGFQLSPTPGNHTMTPPARTPNNDDGIIVIWEDDTLPLSALVQTSGNNSFDATNAQTWSITTANGTPQAGDRVYAATLIENSVAVTTENLTNPSGWTQIAVFQDGSLNLPTQVCWIDRASAGALTPVWTCTADANITNHISVIASFTKAATATVVVAPPSTWDFDADNIDDDWTLLPLATGVVVAATVNQTTPPWDFDADNVDDDWSWWLENTQNIAGTGSVSVTGNSVGAKQAVVSSKSAFTIAAQSIGANQSASSARAASTTAANSSGSKQSASSFKSVFRVAANNIGAKQGAASTRGLRSTIAANSIGAKQSESSFKSSAYSVAQSIGARQSESSFKASAYTVANSIGSNQSALSKKSALAIAANSIGARQSVASSSFAPRLTSAAQSIGVRQSIQTVAGSSPQLSTGGGGQVQYVYSDKITDELKRRFEGKDEQQKAKRKLPRITDESRKAIRAETLSLSKQTAISLDDVIKSVKVAANTSNSIDLQPLLIDWTLYYLRVNAYKQQLQDEEDEDLLLLLS